MLPIILEDDVEKIVSDITADVHSWRKDMIHYIKEVNPELNSAIITLAQSSDIDAKALATGAYMTYKLLESGIDSQDDDYIQS